MNIPIFKLEFDKKFLSEFHKKSEELLTSNRPLSENKYVKEFEEKFAKLVKAKYVIAVSNGTTAIELALKAVGVKDTTVIIPCNTFFATSVAVTNAGAKNALVDVESDNFSIDPVSLERKIKELRSKKESIGAVIIVHIGGIISAHIDEIVDICNKYKIPLIEDAAHAHCSKWGKYRAGTIGVIGCFSFFPTKVMTSGEGGMVTTNNKNYAGVIASLKNFGRDNNNPGICINPEGNNYKVTELTGLLGSMECGRVIKRIKRRNELTNLYVEELKGSSYIPVLQTKGLSSQYKMILKTSIDRDWLRQYCKERNIILTGEVYSIPINKQPLYENEFKNEKFSVTDEISKNHICPPLYPELTNKEVEYICKVLLAAEKDYEK